MLASFAFYGWWNIRYVPLLAGSVIFNYWVGGQIQAAVTANRVTIVKLWRIFGVAANIALLGYFKYTNFLIDNVNLALGTEFTLHHVILPLGISFFTFQKIAYLIDSARGTDQTIRIARVCAVRCFLSAAYFRTDRAL